MSLKLEGYPSGGKSSTIQCATMLAWEPSRTQLPVVVVFGAAHVPSKSSSCGGRSLAQGVTDFRTQVTAGFEGYGRWDQRTVKGVVVILGSSSCLVDSRHLLRGARGDNPNRSDGTRGNGIFWWGHACQRDWKLVEPNVDRMAK